MRVLLVAEQANPEWVSVPLIGWSLSDAIAKLADCHIVTHVRNEQAFLRQGKALGRHFTSIDNEYVAARAAKLSALLRGGEGKGWSAVTAFESVAYYAFEYEVWRRFGQEIREGRYDVVHRITPLSPTAPSLLAKRCFRARVPFVLGPLNGGLRWPPGFDHRRRAEREWLSYVRGVYRLLPGARSKYRYASAILCGSKATAAEVPRRFQEKVKLIPENGIDPARFPRRARNRKSSLPLTAIYVGRLVPYKCPDLLLRASADYVRAGTLRLLIVGDGPLRAALAQQIKDLGLASGVSLLGWVDHSKVHSILECGDFLVLPSIREFGGGVVLEAMAAGLPVVVADYGGPAELVGDDAGFKVPFRDEESLCRNLADTIGALVNDFHTLEKLSSSAQDHVLQRFTWDKKASAIVEIYSRVCGGRKTAKLTT